MATAVKRQVRILHLLCQFSSRDSLFLFVKVNYLRFVGNPYLTGLRGLPVTLDPSLRTSYVMTESGANRLYRFAADNASKWRKQRSVVTRREFVRTFAI